MPTTNAQSERKKEEESLLPYIVTWAATIGAFTLLIYVAVWAVQH